jgi:hypothetical protein
MRSQKRRRKRVVYFDNKEFYLTCVVHCETARNTDNKYYKYCVHVEKYRSFQKKLSFKKILMFAQSFINNECLL